MFKNWSQEQRRNWLDDEGMAQYAPGETKTQRYLVTSLTGLALGQLLAIGTGVILRHPKRSVRLTSIPLIPLTFAVLFEGAHYSFLNKFHYAFGEDKFTDILGIYLYTKENLIKKRVVDSEQ